MKAIIIKFAAKPGAEEPEVPGWLVPDTEDLFGIDQRVEADVESIPPYPARWCITHLPTGMRVSAGAYTEASCRADAAAVAKRFYDEYKRRSWKLRTMDPDEVTNPVKALSKNECAAFWEAVRGAGYSSASSETR